ncbi:hypothetical protein [Segatella salivae]
MGKRGRNSDADFDSSYRDLNVMDLWGAPFQKFVVFMLWLMGLAMNERRKILCFVLCFCFTVMVRLFVESFVAFYRIVCVISSRYSCHITA